MNCSTTGTITPKACTSGYYAAPGMGVCVSRGFAIMLPERLFIILDPSCRLLAWWAIIAQLVRTDP
jgi:hypothetical protein